VPDEPTQERPRRRPVLLAMLVAAALLVAVAGSGLGSGSASGGTDRVTQEAPAADQQGQSGPTHRGRHCHHDRDRQQQDPQSGQPPV
jgi:hypothetical protein